MKRQADAGLELHAFGDELVMVVTESEGNRETAPANTVLEKAGMEGACEFAGEQKRAAAAAQIVRTEAGEIALGGWIVESRIGDAEGEELADRGALQVGSDAQVMDTADAVVAGGDVKGGQVAGLAGGIVPVMSVGGVWRA